MLLPPASSGGVSTDKSMLPKDLLEYVVALDTGSMVSGQSGVVRRPFKLRFIAGRTLSMSVRDRVCWEVARLLFSAVISVLTHSWTTTAMKLTDEDKEASPGFQNRLLLLPNAPKQFVQAKWEICARSQEQGSPGSRKN